MKTSKFLEGLPIHEAWDGLFSSPETNQMLIRAEEEIGEEYTPTTHQVLRFATTDLRAAQVIIYGRDPYPQLNKQGEKVATGRSFEVSYATSWNDTEINRSLKNMMKLIHKSHFNLEKAASIGQVRKGIASEKFKILPPKKVFSYWEKNGVLFLNRSFTCKIGLQKEVSGSHDTVWTDFFERLLQYIYQVNPTVKHFLWGPVQKFAPLLKEIGVIEEYIFTSTHPSDTRSDLGGFQRGSRFYQNPCFRDTMDEIEWVQK